MNDLVKRLRDPRSQFLLDPHVAEEGSDLLRDAADCIEALERRVGELEGALDTIGGGHTNRFPGAPDVMNAASPLDFRSEMWSWSQKVARAALAKDKPCKT